MLGSACGSSLASSPGSGAARRSAALVIGGSIALSMLVACLIGLNRPASSPLQADPRIAAGPVALALADVVTILIYLNVATFFLELQLDSFCL